MASNIDELVDADYVKAEREKIKKKEANKAEERQARKLELIQAKAQAEKEVLDRYEQANIKATQAKLQTELTIQKIRRKQALAKKRARVQKALGRTSLLPRISSAGRTRAIRQLTTQPQGVPQFKIFAEENNTVIKPSREKLRFYAEKREGIIKKSIKQQRWL